MANRINIAPPPVLTERLGVMSGPIEKGGFDHYGVIFTTHGSAKADDFNIGELEGATLEVVPFRGKTEDRFFTILGGYFFRRKGPNEIEIAEVFGIARDAAKGFNLSPGDHVVADEWSLIDDGTAKDSPNMDERLKGNTGWTFIVNHKPGFAPYPYTDDEVAIFIQCPEFESLKVASNEEKESVLVTAKASFSGDAPETVYWNWGDGSKIEAQPAEGATHTYARPADQPATYQITASYQENRCGHQITENVIIPAKAGCPVLTGIDHSEGTQTEDTHEVSFVAGFTGGNPEGLTWDFGDGTKTEETENLTISHSYQRGSADQTHTVTLTATGPGNCSTQGSLEVTIPARPPKTENCPALAQINLLSIDDSDPDRYVVQVQAELAAGSPNPDKYVWNWGDGSPDEESPSSQASHSYDRDSTKKTANINVKAVGPQSCEDSTSLNVQIPAKVTPVPPPTSVPGPLCRVMPFIMALLGALAVDTLLVAIQGVAIAGQPAGQDTLLAISAISIAALVVGLIIWTRIGRRQNCPPTRCDQMAIRWTALLSAMGVAITLVACAQTIWMIVFGVTFVGAGLFLFFWFRRCAPTARLPRFFWFLAIAIAVYLLVRFAIAQPILDCV